MMWLLYIIFGFVLLKCIELLLRYPWITNIHNRCVLVTGCDTGFGHAIAKELDKLQVIVYAGCYTELGEKGLKEACSSRLKPFHLDVSNEKSVQKAFDFVSNDLPKGKGLWGIINNAGIGGSHKGPLDWLIVDDHKEVFNVNYFGLVAMTNAFIPLLKREKGSRIVNTASLAGLLALPFGGPYSPSKHAVEAFSNVLRQEINRFNISVHIVEPTIVRTQINANFESSFNKAWGRLPQETKDGYGQQYFQKLKDSFQEQFDGMGSSDMSPVIEAYKHALFAKFPKKRYLEGILKNILWPLTFLPDAITDRISKLTCNVD